MKLTEQSMVLESESEAAVEAATEADLASEDSADNSRQILFIFLLICNALGLLKSKISK